MKKPETSMEQESARDVRTPKLVWSDGRYLATSLDLAAYVEKPHGEILLSIKRIADSADVHRLNFEPVNTSMAYLDCFGDEVVRQARCVEYYRVTSDGLAVLCEDATDPRVDAYRAALRAVEQKVHGRFRAELDRTTRIVEDCVRALFFRIELEPLMNLVGMRQLDALVLMNLLRRGATEKRIHVAWIEITVSQLASELRWSSKSPMASALGRLLDQGLIHEERRSPRRRAYFAHSQLVIDRLVTLVMMSETAMARRSLLRVVK